MTKMTEMTKITGLTKNDKNDKNGRSDRKVPQCQQLINFQDRGVTCSRSKNSQFVLDLVIYFRVFSQIILALKCVCFETEWRVLKYPLEIRFLLKSVFLSRYKQIVDDMIIQTDKNASDIDVENIVNRKVSLSVLVLAHFGLISIYFAVFFAIIFECIFTSFFYPIFLGGNCY